MTHEQNARAELIAAARTTFARGLSHGTTGNISVRCGAGFLITPTNSSMSDVAAEELALVDTDGTRMTAANPSKEAPLHAAVYQRRPDIHAVVHTHSLYATAVSCLADIDTHDALPAITAYYAMRVDTLPVVPYFPPGATGLAGAVGGIAARHSTMLLRNHGVVVATETLSTAVAVAEEIEQTARLFLLLADRRIAALSDTDRDQLRPHLSTPEPGH